MEWQQLLGFYETAISGSFTKAAKRTFRTPSALSQQIKSLEKEFNCIFFERMGKRQLRLTVAGERLFAFVDNLLKQHQELSEDLYEIERNRFERLRIAGQFASFFFLLPEIIKTYTNKYPFINLGLFERSLQEIIPKIQSGDIDFGIFIEEMIPSDLIKIPWKKAELVLVTPINHPLTMEKEITLEKIINYPMIFPPKQSGYKLHTVFNHQLEKQGLKPRVFMEASTIVLASKYVEMGLGVAFASAGFGLDSLKKRNLSVIPINHLVEMEEYISIIMHKNKILQPHKQAFIDLMLNGKEDTSFNN